ncbi:hypothetical protein BDFB_014542 [Asbolus verrucosus]|uniref:Uncharacterized protein n=1 Tax=Asbolus verrucosus TaxID=1661398 RepID=A0A482VYF3_ASBVE|nr:hypothetical protein BDFB_014542 [Asbolus verrucosus]
MSEKIYLSYLYIMNNAEDLAMKEMINAGKGEYQLAAEAGDIKNGTPKIAVIVDGA